jgi:hypothetical protein
MKTALIFILLASTVYYWQKGLEIERDCIDRAYVDSMRIEGAKIRKFK